MADPRRIIDALLSKTVENGCTPGEAASARAKAEEMATKYGISLEQPKAERVKPMFDDMFHAGVSPQDVVNILRKAQAAAAARRRAREEAFRKAHAKPKPQPQAKPMRRSGQMSVGQAVMWWITNFPNLTNAEVCARVRDEFPKARTTASSVSWYRSKLRRTRP